MENKVQLITYADRFGKGNIRDLHQFLLNHLSDIIGGIHMLPFFYPIDGADAGYDPHDNRKTDERLGDWSDVQSLSEDFPVMADLIVNHVSDQSVEFQDVLKNGSKSTYFDLFLTQENVFGNQVSNEDLNKIYRPRPSSPFSERKLDTSEQVAFWTTFSHSQIDIDVTSPVGEEYIHSVLDVFAKNGIKTIRLDAVGYVIKKAGTSCFMLPETYVFIEDIVLKARKLGMKVLVEIHAHYEEQMKISKSADYVYDFALPPLVLHSLFTKDFSRLKHWLSISPRNCVTVLDTHDGIGVMDVAANGERPGLLNDAELDMLVERIHFNSNGESKQATGAAASNLDIYQVNCTFYDALGKDDLKYLMARAIQFFCPGIPQVYYGGLLAYENDLELLKQTNVGRDINRPFISRERMKSELGKPVVVKLMALIRFRNTHPSFSGDLTIHESPDSTLKMEWRSGSDHARLEIDVNSFKMKICYSAEGDQLKELTYE